MTAIALAGFALATLAAQAWLRGGKVQAGIAGVAGIHALAAAPLLLFAAETTPERVATTLFWVGAGLAWFVVRSHLESSILLALLGEIAAGRADEKDLLRGFHEREGFAVRVADLSAAGLVEERGGRITATARARLVLWLFSWLGEPRATAGPAAGTPSAP